MELKGIGYNARLEAPRPVSGGPAREVPSSEGPTKAGHVDVDAPAGASAIENIATEAPPSSKLVAARSHFQNQTTAGRPAPTLFAEFPRGPGLVLDLGWSSNILHPIPKKSVSVRMSAGADASSGRDSRRSETILLFGVSKFRVNQVAADIYRYKKPEPYKGKGIRYDGEKFFSKENYEKKT